MGARPRLGDIVELSTPKGLAYCQFVAKDPFMGPLLRVLRGLFETRPPDVALLAKEPELYCVHLPLGPSVSRGLVSVVGHAEVVNGEIPPMRRKVGPRTWAIRQGGHDRMTHELTPAERLLSEGSVWNAALLSERLVRGWKPEDSV
jgi:hypothetical protein